MARPNLKNRLVTLISILLLAWCGFFIFFLYQIHIFSTADKSDISRVEAVIVLTGGAGRIEKSLNLFSLIDARKVLISGVDKRVKLNDIIEQFHSKEIMTNINKDSIVLGYVAQDTESNVMETNIFMQLNGYKSCVLVTSSYHLPRSMMAFEEMQSTYKIIPYSSDDITKIDKKLIISEFHKYMTLFLLYRISELEYLYDKGVKAVSHAIRPLIKK